MTKKKHPWGRPTVITDEVIQKLESIFRIDWTVWEACSYAWIWTSTYYDHINSNEEFSVKMKAAQDYPYILARKTLMKWIKDWDNRAAIEYLKRRDRRYNDKQEIESQQNITIELDIEWKSMRELEDIRKELLG